MHCESYLPGYYSMRDPNEGSSSSNWPLLYGDKTLGNGQFRNGYLVGTVSNSCSGGDMDAFRQKMLEHDAVFRHQVVELHRLYQIQKDMMEKSKRKELHNHRTPMETSSSSSPFVSRMHSEDAWKLQKSNIPYLHSKPAVEVLNSNTELRINSPPWSSARGNINQADQFLSQNGCSSNDCEILEVRPSKVRKKLFDLQLPGDAYIDPDNKISDISSRSHIKCLDMNTGSKLKVEHNGDTYMSSSCFRNPTGLADLNEPVQVEEPIHLTQVDSSKSSNFLLGLPREVFNTPQYRSANGISDYLHVNNKGDERGRLSYTYQGHDKTNQSFIPQGAQQDFSLVSHKPMDTTLDKFHHPQSVVESAQVTGDLWREREKPLHGLRIQETSRDPSSLYHLEPVSTLTHKLTSIQTHLPLNLIGPSNTSSHSPSKQSQEIMNRLYCGQPPPWIKDPPARFPSTVLQSLKSDKYDKVASERSINYSPSKRAKEVNLNVCPSKCSCIDIVDVEKESKDPIKVLPWLKTETLKGLDQVSTQKVSERSIFGVPIFDKSCCTTKKESSSSVSTSASLKDKGKSVIIDINIPCDIECSTEIADEKPLSIEKSGCEKAATFRVLFDLNSCVSEDEITLAPSMASTNANNGRIMIDLEAVPAPDEDEQTQDEAGLIAAQEIVTISSFTASIDFEAPSPDSLLWFVEIVSSFIEDFENSGTMSRISPNKIDDFEVSTLNLREMTEEEYMPKPLVPDIVPDENGSFEIGNAAGRIRTRRGAGRRGTRRRDFQRDILPGLASLSRHEVSEDIHTFGGLMRATGHVWSSGVTRRNGTRGGGRGRRRVAVDPPAVDIPEPAAVCPSLTEGVDIWGRTPRRPRRQRGVAGNPPSGHLA